MNNSRVLSLLALCLSFGMTLLAEPPRPGPEGDHHPGYSYSAHVGPRLEAISLSSGNNIKAYVPGPLDGRVWDLEARVNSVREKWLYSLRKHNSLRVSVSRSAFTYGTALTRVPDDHLGLGGLIIKHEYACFSFVIAAANAQSSRSQLSNAQIAEGYCKDAAVYLDRAINGIGRDQNAEAVAEWARSSDEQPRIQYLAAMAECLHGKAVREPRLQEQAANLLDNQIPRYYLARFPPAKDAVLSSCTIQH